ncbi:hypothetical protein [Cupriavidus sp. SW-Y-13]|uniref:hypothetical protein n=1 Tax=Cupriavidus sp. SW-Y-13 TaxID=2653854 RepID=UPI0013656526|nr:hypothetical protein [Cupriavidus sp. SW-Y-13]MWL89105.1 hypothetical protein [Cupriavidus sp. SW-Y-13]
MDRFNRQLHPDERKWAKDNAKEFAEFYAEKTGKELTDEQAQRMLLASGYRLVDDMASKGVAGDKYAVAFISANAGSLFSATAEERRDPGPLGGPLTPEQRAMPAHNPNPQLGMAAGAGLGLVAVGTVAPVVATGWALGTAYDYGSDTLNYSSGLSDSPPDVRKSVGVGGIFAAFSPMGLTMTHFGKGIGAKIVAGTYNAGRAGTASFGASSIYSPDQNPGLAGGLGFGSAALSPIVRYAVPGRVGIFVDSVIQITPGSLQKIIENSHKETK